MEPNFQLRLRGSGSLEPFPYIHFHQKILLLKYYNPALSEPELEMGAERRKIGSDRAGT